MNPTLQQPDIKLANEIVKQHNNYYGDIGIGLGSTINAITIGICLYNIFKQELDIDKTINRNYLRKEKQLSGGFLVLTIILVVVYFIMNYFIIRKEFSKSGWFDWIYFGLSIAILITFLVLTLNLNPCPKFINTGLGSALVHQDP